MKDKIKEILERETEDLNINKNTRNNLIFSYDDVEGMLEELDDSSSTKNERDEFNEGICKCGHHSKDHSYNVTPEDNNLYCDECDCKDYEFNKFQEDTKSALNSQVGNRGRFTPSEGGNALQENPRRNKKLMDVGNPDTNPEQDCNCLNEKESIEFLKKMKETEEREPTEKEKEMAEGIKEIAKCYCPEQCVENIIEDCVIIKVKDIPEHMCNIDLTWLDREILRIKDRLRNRLQNKGVKNGK